MSANPVLPPPPPKNAIVSLLLRLAFYVGTGFIGLQILPLVLMPLFGIVVASTLGLFVLAVTANVITLRVFDRRPLTHIGLDSQPGWRRNLFLGLIVGSGSAALMLIAPLLAGTGHMIYHSERPFSWLSLIFYLVVLLFGAAGEEILFRGYAFQLLIEKMGPWATALPVGVLFGFAHASNPSATLLSIINTSLWGILLGAAFIKSHDLWLPIGLHYGWNATLPLFGTNLSGLTIEVTRYSYQWDLGTLWSGGSYGPEGGLLTTIFVIVLFFLLARLPVKPQKAEIASVLNDW